MEGLVKGRMVYLVLSLAMVEQITRRRTTGASIAGRMAEVPPAWPAGAQAHVGNPVQEGDVVPCMVLRVSSDADLAPVVNLRAFLDGSDEYWATSVPYDESLTPGTWHWMYQGQATRGNAK
jgi:hypothetical protein